MDRFSEGSSIFWHILWLVEIIKICHMHKREEHLSLDIDTGKRVETFKRSEIRGDF